MDMPLSERKKGGCERMELCALQEGRLTLRYQAFGFLPTPYH
jgi:hypothetical protein